MDEKTYSVSQYNTAVQRYLADKVPDTWVYGVITQLNVRGRVAYISIGQFDEGSPRPKSTLQVFLWADELETINLRLSRLPTPFELRVELKVSLLLKAEFYVPLGKFQPRVLNIDENFTLGELAQTRKKIIDTLMKEGLFEKNKKLELSPVPLQVGLITAPGSAAFKDFTTVLLGSGFSFQIFFSPAKMQGEQTEGTVVKAIQKLQRLPLDIICIVRGGGARTDLIYFDSEKICRAIANAPYPVLTGIGHEIDESIADMVAHLDKITPTDCAKFLEARLHERHQDLLQHTSNISEHWKDRFQLETGELQESARYFKQQWERRHSEESKEIVRLQVGLARGPGKLIELVLVKFGSRVQRFQGLWKSIGTEMGMNLLNLRDKMSRALSRRLTEEKRALALNSRGLRMGPGKLLQPEREALGLKSKLIYGADPARQLEKGYSLLRDSKGRLIRQLKNVSEGDAISAEISDGFLDSKITSTREKP